ncbi:MAG: hypothetical protein SFV54_26490 [Bryobacteraceae bacterium]|nr:hypothetical protein [Bryobacteraceae bacterium]
MIAWYGKVAASGGLSSLPEHVSVDIEVFRAFQELVPSSTLDYLKDRNFAGHAFERAPLQPIFRYAHYADRVTYEFLDAELEAARGAFVDAVRRFDRAISLNTWTTDNIEYSTVPPEWESEQPERFDRVVTDIHESADAIEAAYAVIVRLARRRLGVVGVIEPKAPDV